jgi:very-short-patch-repair endonuclease
MLGAAIEEATYLKEAESSLTPAFDLTLVGGVYSASQLHGYAALLDEATVWQRLFGRDYKQAVKAYRNIAKRQTKTIRSQMSRDLRAVAQYKERRDQFDTHTGYREMMGANFQGVHSAWEDLHHLHLWYGQVFEALPEHQSHAEPFRHLLLTARIGRLKAINAGASAAPEHRSALGQIVERVPHFTRSVPSQRSLMVSGSLDEILECVEKLAVEVEDALRMIDQAALREDVSLRTVPAVISAAKQCVAATDAIQKAVDIPTLVGASYLGVNTDTAPIKNTVQFAETIASGNLPQKTIQRLLCADYRDRIRELRAMLTGASECSRELQRIAADLVLISGYAAWNMNADDSWGARQALAAKALSSPDELPRWGHFIRVRIKSGEAGLGKLAAMAEEGTLQPQELVPAFHFVFYNALSRNVLADNGDLSQITGITQELLRNQFAAADKEAIRLYSERVATLIDQRQAPYGNHSGPVRTWSEMALIINETNKQKRHIPIRQLILRSARALQAIKPCFMMGPLSVAQYLAPGQLKFDLVVMDEASQLRPEDAIGALARGGQVVIVGDPKQLPPTSFFQRVSLDADDDDADSRTAVEEGESILDVASTLFQPVRRLRWHYRSRHHSLIAFSNEEFYQRDLIIFPSAYHDDPLLGVKYHFIPNGVCENSRNPAEAAKVVEAVMEHMREHPDESLGIVTLNFEQRELVEELLDKRLRDDPAAIAYQEKMRGGQETLFVKNLENVQGDERDVIFISTTYGPDSRGNQFQRFGPINGANGHRRLNVLFTRAKKRTVVFSSLDPDKIQTTANSPWGVRALKDYLLYARTGILQQADDGNDQPTNDFERSIGAVLKENNYDVVPQVGVAGFFIDLGVRHPTKPGTFLVGIECDGASYHSGRSARDRDRLRQEILVNLGWKIYRIWSTDWFKNRDSEVKRLLKHVAELLANDPEYLQQKLTANRIDLLRDQLTSLRDTEIRANFPDTPLDQGLLNPDLLEAFVQKRPKTRDDWFRRIPQQQRTAVDSKQVGRYLDRVLDIIAESET